MGLALILGEKSKEVKKKVFGLACFDALHKKNLSTSHHLCGYRDRDIPNSNPGGLPTILNLHESAGKKDFCFFETRM